MTASTDAPSAAFPGDGAGGITSPADDLSASCPSSAQEAGAGQVISGGLHPASTLLSLLRPQGTPGHSTLLVAGGGGSPVSTIGDLTKVLTTVESANGHNVWHGVQPVREDLTQGRGRAADVAAVVTFYADLDDKTGSRDAQRGVIADLSTMVGADATAVVMSGHGLQPYWVLEEPLVITDAKTTGLAANLMKRWGRLVATVAAAHGLTGVDNVWDLPRVLRTPGTLNSKPGMEPVRAALEGASGAVVSLEAVRDALDAAAIPEETDDRQGKAQASQEQVDAFLDEHTASQHPDGLRGVLSALERDLQGERHRALLRALPWALEEAQRGDYPARLAAEAVKAAWEASYGPHRPGERQKPDAWEWPEALAWAVGQRIGQQPRERIDPTAGLGAPGIDGDDVRQQGEDGADLLWEQDVADALYRLKVQREAKDRLHPKEEPPPAVNLSDLLAMDLPEPLPTIQGWIHAGSKTLVSGPNKAGKTTLMANLVATLADAAAGTFWLGRWETMPVEGPIHVIDLEMDQRRLQEWLASLRIVNSGQVIIHSLRGRASALDVLTPDGRVYWSQRLGGAGYVIVDPVGPALAAAGLEENSNADVARWLAGWDEVIRLAGSPGNLLAHHHGKAGETARGASAWEGWPDAFWTLTKNASEEEGDFRSLGAIGRDISQAAQVLVLDPMSRRLTLAGFTRGEARAGALVPAVVEYVTEHPGASQTAVEQAVEGKTVDLRKALGLAVERGLLTMDRGARGAKVFHPVPPRPHPVPDGQDGVPDNPVPPSIRDGGDGVKVSGGEHTAPQKPGRGEGGGGGTHQPACAKCGGGNPDRYGEGGGALCQTC